jgi:hypothetical protein
MLQFRVWKSIKRNIVLEALNTSIKRNIVLQFRVWKSIKRNIVLEALNTSEVGRQGDQETTVHSHTSHYRIFSVID